MGALLKIVLTGLKIWELAVEERLARDANRKIPGAPLAVIEGSPAWDWCCGCGDVKRRTQKKIYFTMIAPLLSSVKSCMPDWPEWYVLSVTVVTVVSKKGEPKTALQSAACCLAAYQDTVQRPTLDVDAWNSSAAELTDSYVRCCPAGLWTCCCS
jgi:hypothetical protein